jgi:hypothetical protein
MDFILISFNMTSNILQLLFHSDGQQQSGATYIWKAKDAWRCHQEHAK